ncbi:MAG: two-component sensor histidine kinase [Novosphingobium sp.]|nr:two-component sensor histidine kinase [Novosphingobium sp.]
MLLAVALALLLVQGLGALLVYQAQAERREAALVHGAAFRLLGEVRGGRVFDRGEDRRERIGSRRRGPPVEHSATSPQVKGEVRDSQAEKQLERIMAEQGFIADDVVVVRRPLTDDPPSLRRAMRRAAFNGHDIHQDDIVLVAGIHLESSGEWIVARIVSPWRERDAILPLFWQTLFIYVVVVGVVALVLRRITRPLAALTNRLEHFAETQNPDGQIAPEGPDDVRRLIDAHNAMEARIAALLDEKDVMLGAIGHDLKTPLAALRVRIESVENETERERMAATVEDITRTLDDILSLARVGRPSDPLEQSELSALVASIVEEYEDMGEPVELGSTQRIALPLRATWLRRALRNLIGNALRYGKCARVSVAREDSTAVIRIEDNGPGIPEGNIAAMMEPFTRGEPSRNTETGGAGLGLTLARAIADQHGGSLNLENRRGADGQVKGLVATLRLPLA